MAVTGMTVCALSQVSYGIRAGLNVPTLTFSANNISYKTNSSTNFHVSGFVDAPIATNLSIQPGLSVHGKGGKLDDQVTDFNNVSLSLLYLELPVNFVYYIPTGESGDFFAGAGPYAGYGLTAKGRANGESESASFEEAGVKNFDAGLNFLLGYKLRSGLLFNAGYGLGLANISNDSDVTIKNKVWQFGLGFQF